MPQPPIPEISTTINPEQLAALLRRMESERQVIA